MKHMASLLPGPMRLESHLRRSRLEAIFPFYHAVSDQALPHTRHLYAPRSLARFEADLDYLCKYFEPVGMSDFLEGKLSQPGNKPPMVLSLDDGLVPCFEEVMPLLLRKGIPATFFLNNDFIDNKELFFRFKASLLVEQLPMINAIQKSQAGELLRCNVNDLKKRLLSISYKERHLTDEVAGIWSCSFQEHLSSNPVYLSSSQIREMQAKGFEFGAHGFDHPHFSDMPAKETLEHIRQSMEDLQIRFKLDYRYFAFPFTDFGVGDQTIEDLFRLNILDVGFGTAGLKDDRWEHYYQRVPMEFRDLGAKGILRGEMNRRRMRKLLGRNQTLR